MQTSLGLSQFRPTSTASIPFVARAMRYPFLLMVGWASLIATAGNAMADLPEMPSGPRLKDLGAQHHLLIGAATDLNHNDPNEEAIIKNEYSILSDENCLKPKKTELAKNTFDFAKTDQWVKFCMDNHIIAKGHVLIARDSYLPKWMLDPKLTGDDLDKILVNHINHVMGRYKTGSPYGEIKYWDVLNEVITYPAVFEKIGKDSDGDFLYWEHAFRAARAVDPKCVLVWNEDNIEVQPKKAEKLYQTIKRLKARGVPIDAVGFQCHIGFHKNPVPDYKYLTEIFQKFADIGVSIVVSEMDVPDNLSQADIYQNVLRVCINQPKCIIWDTWNVVDKYSWRRRKEHGLLLFDNDYRAKPVYYAVQSALEKPSKPSATSNLPPK